MKRAKDGRRDLPRGVRRVGNGYQAWAMIDGKRTYSRTVYAVEDAERIAVAMRQGVRGALPEQRTLGMAMQKVLDLTANAQTRAFYDAHFKAIAVSISRQSVLGCITRQHIMAMRDQMTRTVAPRTVNHRLAALNRAFGVAVDLGWCEHNPAVSRSVKRAAAKRTEMDWFEAGEFVQILSRIRADPSARSLMDSDLMAVMAMTGMRRSELARSQVRDWNLRSLTLSVSGKTDHRSIPFGEALLPSVQRIIDASDGGSFGTSKPKHISYLCHRWAVRLEDRRLHPHALRHTFATTLVRNGHDVGTVQYLMGHASIAMTMRYFHVCGVAARNAVADLRLLPPEPTAAPADPSPPAPTPADDA